MKVKMILPALTEATSARHRPIKYSLFPPLGLATLAAHLDLADDVVLNDEHVESLDLDDAPDLVVIQCYVTSARRSYQLADHYRARGAHVALGGLHPTALPHEAAAHADSVFVGPGDHSFAEFLRDLGRGEPRRLYVGRTRSLDGVPPPRRDLIARDRYLVPNSLVVSRGCPHHCDFCYKDAFFKGGRSFYTQAVDDALAEIARLPGRHLFFLDDQLFADERFVKELFVGMRGMGRVWQAAGTVRSILRPRLMELAAEAGLRSLFVGFESLSDENLRACMKLHSATGDYERAVARLHALGVMVNGSFVFGLDSDDESVFGRTVDWAVAQGIETATFHILTPYPGTRLRDRLAREGRLLPRPWDEYDTRHAVFRPARMSPQALEAGYWRAYDRFYRWRSILAGAATKPTLPARLRHLAYAGGWKKLEPMWNAIINSGALPRMRPVLEATLDGLRATRQLLGAQRPAHPLSCARPGGRQPPVHSRDSVWRHETADAHSRGSGSARTRCAPRRRCRRGRPARRRTRATSRWPAA